MPAAPTATKGRAAAASKVKPIPIPVPPPTKDADRRSDKHRSPLNSPRPVSALQPPADEVPPRMKPMTEREVLLSPRTTRKVHVWDSMCEVQPCHH